MPVAGLRVLVVGPACGCAPRSSDAGVRAGRPARRRAAAARRRRRRPGRAAARRVRGALRPPLRLHPRHLGVRVRVAGRLARRSRTIVGALDASPACLLGIPLQDIRVTYPRRDGSGVDSNTAPEGAVETHSRAEEAADTSEVPLSAAADSPHGPLLRDTPPHPPSTSTKVRHVPPPSNTLV